MCLLEKIKVPGFRLKNHLEQMVSVRVEEQTNVQAKKLGAAQDLFFKPSASGLNFR
jgi:hypothetical protein